MPIRKYQLGPVEYLDRKRNAWVPATIVRIENQSSDYPTYYVRFRNALGFLETVPVRDADNYLRPVGGAGGRRL